MPLHLSQLTKARGPRGAVPPRPCSRESHLPWQRERGAGVVPRKQSPEPAGCREGGGSRTSCRLVLPQARKHVVLSSPQPGIREDFLPPVRVFVHLHPVVFPQSELMSSLLLSCRYPTGREGADTGLSITALYD